jgi:hypothetical protein
LLIWKKFKNRDSENIFKRKLGFGLFRCGGVLKRCEAMKFMFWTPYYIAISKKYSPGAGGSRGHKIFSRAEKIL